MALIAERTEDEGRGVRLRSKVPVMSSFQRDKIERHVHLKLLPL